MLWFAWKYLPLWYQQQLWCCKPNRFTSCDLLENIYLCGINNNVKWYHHLYNPVVICLKISTFVVSTTTEGCCLWVRSALWFAWKYLPLWYQQQQWKQHNFRTTRCDLLENIYLCGINNNPLCPNNLPSHVVICLKTSTFVVSTTTQTLNTW